MEAIEPKVLSAGTIILVETVTQVFEFTVLEGGRLLTNCAGKRCFGRQTIDFIGCLGKNGMIYAGKIVEDCHLILKTEDGQFVSGCVKSASIRGENYSYELW